MKLNRRVDVAWRVQGLFRAPISTADPIRNCGRSISMDGRIREALREERRIPTTSERADASPSATRSRDCCSSIETGALLAGDPAGMPLDWGIQETPPPVTSSTAPGESRIGLQN